MEQNFSVSVDTVGGVPVVRVRGEVDVATAPELRQCLQGADIAGRSKVVIDLLGVTFLDSTALGVLVGALKRSRETDAALRLVVAEARILKVFEITGLTDVFEISDSVDKAVMA